MKVKAEDGLIFINLEADLNLQFTRLRATVPWCKTCFGSLFLIFLWKLSPTYRNVSKNIFWHIVFLFAPFAPNQPLFSHSQRYFQYFCCSLAHSYPEILDIVRIGFRRVVQIIRDIKWLGGTRTCSAEKITKMHLKINSSATNYVKQKCLIDNKFIPLV